MYGALLLSGLLGSLGHCLGMCSPLVVMLGVQLRREKLAGPHYHFLYHGARIAVYALLGAVAGGLGSLLGLGRHLGNVAGAVSLALGALVILLGLGYLGWLPLGRLEGAGAWLSRAMSRALARGGYRGLFLLGALNGLLPCGLVYSALLLAAAAGGALPGALGMVIFGAGTLPALLAIGLGAGTLSARARQTMARVAGLFIVVAGLQLMLRGGAALGLVPHLKVGGVMLW